MRKIIDTMPLPTVAWPSHLPYMPDGYIPVANVCPMQGVPDREDEYDRILRILGREELFRFVYVPFVLAQLVWDYADTVVTLAASLRFSKVKGLCRTVRELRRSYDKERSRYIDSEHVASEERNMYVFEENVAHITRQLLVNIRVDLRGEYPELGADHLEFLVAVYQCGILLKSLLRYAKIQADKVGARIDRTIGHILPRQMYSLDGLMPDFAGDKPVSARFASLKEEYIVTLAAQMGLVGLDDTPELKEGS